MNVLLRMFAGVRSCRDPAMLSPSGVLMVTLQGRPCMRALRARPSVRSADEIEASLADLRAQRRAIDIAIENLEIERLFATGEEPEFLQEGPR